MESFLHRQLVPRVPPPLSLVQGTTAPFPDWLEALMAKTHEPGFPAFQSHHYQQFLPLVVTCQCPGS